MGLTVEWRTFEVRNGIKGKRAPGTIRSDGLNGRFSGMLLEADGLRHHGRPLRGQPSAAALYMTAVGGGAEINILLLARPIFLSLNTRRSTGQTGLPLKIEEGCVFKMQRHQYGTPCRLTGPALSATPT